MRLSEEQLQALPKIYDKIKGVKIAMLTTIDRSSGMLHSRPMATQVTETGGHLWFFTAADAVKVDEIQHEHHVNVSYAAPGSDRYVSLCGLANVVRDDASIKKLWQPTMRPWFPQGPEDPNLALVEVRIEEAEYWDHTSSKMVQLPKT